MQSKQLIYRLASLCLAVALLSALPVSGQCSVVSVVNMTTSFGTIMTVQIMLNGFYNIESVSGNASACNPGSVMADMTLTASASTSYVSPFCRWNCIGANCGTCNTMTLYVDSSDGLPVELMGFDVVAEGTETALPSTEPETSFDE